MPVGSGENRATWARLLGWAEAGVGLERGEHQNFKHAGLEDGEGGESGADFCLAGGLPKDGGAGDIAALPELAAKARGVEFADRLGFADGEFRGEGFRRELVRETAGDG
jgi:hypothetical protein